MNKTMERSLFSRIRRRLRSRSGESLGETLISLLVASLALVMLAGAISSAKAISDKGSKLNTYYSDMNELVIKREDSGTPGTVRILGSNGDDTIDFTKDIEYFTLSEDGEFGGTPVVSYKYVKGEP